MQLIGKTFENNQAILTIQAEAEEVEKALEAAYQRLVEQVDIRGFRKGKAPREVLERNIGKERLLDEALSDLLPKLSIESIKAEGLQAISSPTIRVTKVDPVVFEVIVPLPPEVKLGNYNEIRAELASTNVDSTSVDKMIQALRRERAVWQPADRPARHGDMVVIDINSEIDGQPFLKQEGGNLILTEGSLRPLPGFAEQLVGMSPAEEKEFDLTVPADFSDPEKAGRVAHFWVKVLSIKEEVLPELDNDFARSLGSDIEDVDGLYERVRASLEFQASERARENLEREVVDKLVEQSDISFPPVMLEDELNYLISEQLGQLQRSARSEQQLQEWLKDISIEKMRDELRPVAEKRVRQALALDKLAEDAKLELTDAEIDAEIERQVSYAGGDEKRRESLNTPTNRDSIRRIILRRKALELLMDIAQGKDKQSAMQVASENADSSIGNEEVS